MSGGVVSFNAVGTCILDASQGGNDNYSAATDVYQYIAVVVPSATSTTVYSSMNPSTHTDTITLTANVNSGGGIPTGTVGFTTNGNSIYGCSSLTLDPSGNATCTPTVSMLGVTNLIEAVYIPNTTVFISSTSAVFNQYIENTTIPTVPAAPVDVVAVPGNEQVTVSWYPPANTGGQEITGYSVQ